MDAGGSLIELFVGEALQPPAFSRSQLSDSAPVVDTVPVLSGQGEHGFLRFLHSSSVLTGLFPVGTENGSGAFFYQYTGMLPTVLADTGILPCRHTSGGIRDLGIGIQVYEVQPCFSTPSSGSGGLGAGDSADIVNPLSLGTWDKLLKIRAIAAGERKYFSDTPSSKISDNIQPLSVLGDSEKFAVMHTPFQSIPQVRKSGEDGLKCPAPVMRQQPWDVFQKKKCRPFFSNDSGNFKDKSASHIRESSPLSRNGETLTRKSRTDKVKVGHSFGVNFSCVITKIRSFRIIDCTVSCVRFLVDLAMSDAFKAAHSFQT